MPKHRNIAKLLKGRIKRGDYRLRQFPSTLKLAAELDIDRRTATRAMSDLIADGLLIKTDTGRVMPRKQPDAQQPHLALLAPAFSTATIDRRFAAIQRLVQRRGWNIRLVSYTHAQESLVFEAAGNFDGLFIVPIEDDLPTDVLAKLAANRTKVVALIADLSAHDIPSLTFENNTFVAAMLDHLYDNGYRCVACVNSQPGGRTISSRIDQWRLWTSMHKAAGSAALGPLLDQPVEHFVNPMSQARDLFSQYLDTGVHEVDAVFCTTGSAAVGVMRTIADHGLVVGRDIGVCAADGHGMAEFLTPTLTSPTDRSEDVYFEICLDYFADPQTPWSGPLVVQPRDIPIFLGQSTAPRRVKRSSFSRAAKRHDQHGE